MTAVLERHFELAKNIAALFGTASVFGYACGYLVLRARSFVLGTDPAFKLVDQVYVFAGFRFFVVTLVILLLLLPLILIVRWTALWLGRVLPDAVSEPMQWVTLVLVAMMTLFSMSIVTASSILLRADPLPDSGLEGAVLGGPDGLRLGLTVAPVLLAGLSALWLHHRVNAGAVMFAWFLAMMVALQAFMLPIYHGALFADRRVRVLSQLPAKIQGLVEPVAIVDRTAEQATLLGLDAAGRRGLATVPLAELDGIPVQAVVPLEDFLRCIGASREGSRAAGVLGVHVADGVDATGAGQVANDTANYGIPVQAVMPSEDFLGCILAGHDVPRAGGVLGVQVADAAEIAEAGEVAEETANFEGSFYGSLAGYFGLVLESIGSLGGGAGDAGELWTVSLDASGQPSGLRRVGEVDDISWPVVGADGASFIALQADRIVRLDATGAVAAVLAEGGYWRRLLGEREDGAVLGLVRSDGETRPALLAPDGTLQVGDAPATDEEKRTIGRLLQDARAYQGGWTLTIDRSERGGRGLDVFLRSPKGTYNLSKCGDDYCGQASLSRDQRRAVFVRAVRY